jgi:hypothetical protein
LEEKKFSKKLYKALPTIETHRVPEWKSCGAHSPARKQTHIIAKHQEITRVG